MDPADFFCVWDTKCGTSELRVPAGVQLQTNDHAQAPPPTTFGQLMESLGIVPGISQRQQATSQPGSSHIGLGLVRPELESSIPSGEPTAEPN